MHCAHVGVCTLRPEGEVRLPPLQPGTVQKKLKVCSGGFILATVKCTTSVYVGVFFFLSLPLPRRRTFFFLLIVFLAAGFTVRETVPPHEFESSGIFLTFVACPALSELSTCVPAPRGHSFSF